MINESNEMTTNTEDKVALEGADIPDDIPTPRLRHPSTRSPSRLKIAMIAFLVVVGVGVAIGTGIQTRLQAEGQLARSTRISAIPSVFVTHPRAGAAGGEVELPGNTQPFNDTPIYARVSGYLKSWKVDIGTRVKQGELLAEIDAPEVDQQLMQARADLKNAQVNVEFARITADRYQGLVKTASVSQQETDQTVSDFHSRQTLVDASQANVHRLEELQSFERIYAPFDGVITARNTDLGALIQAGENTGPKELFHLAAVEKLRVYVSVPEAYVAAATSGSKVALTFNSSFPGETFPGTVVRSANAIDPNSRTLNVEVDMDNSSGRVLPGAYAFVHLKTPPSTQAVTIPANTLLFRAEGLRGECHHCRSIRLPRKRRRGAGYGSPPIVVRLSKRRKLSCCKWLQPVSRLESERPRCSPQPQFFAGPF
jgi:RND family efflux transporter MFP subunit